MIFTTCQFVVFFILVYILFFTLPRGWRYPLLLAASYYFYMCSIPAYLLVIIAITLIDFVAALQMEKARNQEMKRCFLVLSILSNFGILVVFKYVGFLTSNVNSLFGLGLPVLHLLLPLGISFHTFQAVSYTIEVYRGRHPAEHDLLKYALYVAFFPQMVAGPIERPYNLLPQFNADHPFCYRNFQEGLRISLWGAFKKIVAADTLARVVTTVYGDPHKYPGPILGLATFFFAIQIYCDFSGYSDIAIGVARMMGFRLMVNFRQPYFARSIGEFWHRWHVSLSTWFRDYLYVPLGGNRVSRNRHLFNLMVVFLVSGLWHGANWTFLVWGGLHGVYLVTGLLTAPLRGRVKRALGLEESSPGLGGLQRVTTFALVTLAWVFFRCARVADGLYIVTHLFQVRGFRFSDLFLLGLPRFEMMLAFVLILVVGATEWLMAHETPLAMRWWSFRPFRWACCYACLFGIIFFGVFERIEFIYFQF